MTGPKPTDNPASEVQACRVEIKPPEGFSEAGPDRIKLPLAFRDYVVLLAASKATVDIYRDMIKPLGFYKILDVHEGPTVLRRAKQISPNLVVASTDIPIFSGPQILSAARQDSELTELPFLIIGAKEDARPGGLADNVRALAPAAFVGLPTNSRELTREVVNLMTPLIDPNHEKALELMDQAAELVKADNLHEAAILFVQATSLNPTHLGAKLSLAAVFADLDNFDGAEEAYLGALDLDPYSMVAYFGLAELYERRGDYEHTISVLTQALGLAKMLKASDKSISRINFFIGEFELRLERLRKAAESFELAVDQNPDDAVLRSDIGDSYLEKGYLAECEEHYLAALTIDPNQAHIFNRLGIAYRKQKNTTRP